MIEDQQLTIAGTLGGDPELRFTPAGVAVCNFSVAVNHRYFDKNANEWKERGTDWWRCNAWRQLAENITESFRKGDRVIVVGKVASRSFETQQGQKVITWEMTVEEAGPSVKWATATVHKAERTQAGGQQQGQYDRGGQRGGGQQSEDPWGSPPPPQANYGRQGSQQGGRQETEDPWASAPPSNYDQSYQRNQGGFADEPPF